MVRMDDKRVILERGDKGYDKSWMALIDSGKNPNDWMYMYSEGNKAFFKNKMMRNYISVEA
jgi:hypothetical protein